ncbi:MAG: ribonuclease HII [Candidatus Sumerlaeia bacterium]|nr:ribonuclease HII [Candidatus Sumerlaeia bacterium]
MIARPSWRYEQKVQRTGYRLVAGIDEAGRGPLAGPVVAAAVVFPPGFRMDGLADSKQLQPDVRRALDALIRQNALAVGVGIASAEEIDRLNILAATHLAAQRAVENLKIRPDYLITDCLRLDWAEVPVEPLVRGDQKCASVAAASVVAKVARDRLMCDYDSDFPGYGFADHKGYATATHVKALRTLGPTTLHRLSFRGVSWFETELRRSQTFIRLAEAIAGIEDAAAARAVQHALDEAMPRLPERENGELRRLFAARMAACATGGTAAVFRRK